MIQVLCRAFDMLSLIGKHDGMRLTDLAASVDIGRTTAGNILSTLKRLGYLAQNDKSEYLLSDNFYALAATKANRDRDARIAEENVRMLAERVNESVVLASLVNGERCTLAEARADRALTVNTDVYRDGNLLSTVTGRILLAYMNAKERAGQKKYRIDAALEAELTAIREKGIGILSKSDIAAVGVPILTRDGVWAAIGVYLPAIRFTGKHRIEIIDSLRSIAKRVETQLNMASLPGPKAAA